VNVQVARLEARSGRSAARARGRRGGNLPADADTRLRKQLRDLLSHGYRVSVITPAGQENQPYREVRNLTLLEYPHPLNPAV
jgi:hypothetical protein